MGGPKRNHAISRRKIREFCESHPDHKDAYDALNRWFKITEAMSWGKFADVKATFGAADQVGDFVVFDVGGNKYRVITEIIYDETTVVLLRYVLTHAEYDKGGWKS
jgi:mRNA interferase HigB